LIVCKSIARLISIPLILFLVPHGTPDDVTLPSQASKDRVRAEQTSKVLSV
jgi:hypothetical protein